MSDKSAEPTAPSKSGSDELKIARDNRVFEIQMFWQRSNYFLVLMSALGIATFSIKETLFAPVVAGFAAISSFLWFRVNLGSKFWQESWEVEVNSLAKERGIRSFERPMSAVREQVRKSLFDGWEDEKHSQFSKWIDGEITKKFSVTHHMIVLSLFSFAFWVLVSIFLVARIFVVLPIPAEQVVSQPKSRAESVSDYQTATLPRLSDDAPCKLRSPHTCGTRPTRAGQAGLVSAGAAAQGRRP